MAAAARLGMRGRPLSRPNPGVGAIIVADGTLAGRGWTQAGGRPHGEAMALSQAGDLARGATLYTTLEPCAHPSQRGPTCSALIAEAGIARVVFACLDPDIRTCGEGAAILQRAGISVTQIDSAAAEQSLAGYMMRRVQGRPHVTLKLAMSLDGLIALPSGESQWITGETARAHVHSRRAMADAILVGGGTWRADKPRLDVRLPGIEDRSPRRVVLTRGVPIDGIRIINIPGQIAELDDVHYLYVEGGAQTAASFLRADLVDRIELYRAPILLGTGLPALGDIGLTALADAHGRWHLVQRSQLGSDTFEAYVRRRSPTA
ncbi:bifunctional diaminohydroxyphosphoribosylaminopyrimidine deaminase/5-amino-6-(5-phosphoribosylamino)uracil reductase RibD [Pontixanthobacter sp.]|uniref:bifunctional diaminohydroxyphosphoribosylaminopyrimidine deaminase/5-amino-6-(5-phosphoribosylamino)uracil reductase RibD n=1 Tax=Pontixanthobacter sp. TaxID=2792078 RepID=UPI003C7DD5B9